MSRVVFDLFFKKRIYLKDSSNSRFALKFCVEFSRLAAK